MSRSSFPYSLYIFCVIDYRYFFYSICRKCYNHYKFFMCHNHVCLLGAIFFTSLGGEVEIEENFKSKTLLPNKHRQSTMPPKQKAGLNSPASSPKKTSPSGVGSGSSTAPVAGTPLRSSESTKSGKSAPKVPESLIVRPAATSSHKTLLKIYAHNDTYKQLGITNGDLVLISKPGERGVVVIATAASPNTAQDSMSTTYCQLGILT